MPKRKYKDINFSKERRDLIETASGMIATYQSQGYSLTLRQLYYRFVAADILPESWADVNTGSKNNERSYKKLGDVLADARLAGLIDWSALVDRTRELDGDPYWDSPEDILESCAGQFRVDTWDTQEHRVEVWVEKDALEGVVGKAARALGVKFFSCRGYASMTSIWDAGQRLKRFAEAGQRPVILHLGDHDPSGIDMSRDILERVSLFMDDYGGTITFKRIALNMDQVKRYKPPPNPAKVTDSRYEDYRKKHGEESWELDALEPAVIDKLIRDNVLRYRDEAAYEDRIKDQARHREHLSKAAKYWDNGVVALLEKKK